jgi:hypothetical protein
MNNVSSIERHLQALYPGAFVVVVSSAGWPYEVVVDVIDDKPLPEPDMEAVQKAFGDVCVMGAIKHGGAYIRYEACAYDERYHRD